MNNRLEPDGKPKYRVGEATRERILEVAGRLGYSSAEKSRSMIQGGQRMVVVLLRDPEKDALLARDLERDLYRQGRTVLFAYSWGDPIRYERLLQWAGKQNAELVDLIKEET